MGAITRDDSFQNVSSYSCVPVSFQCLMLSSVFLDVDFLASISEAVSDLVTYPFASLVSRKIHRTL